LGYLGDPRLGRLVTIPAGEFWMGEGQKKHKLFLSAYQIGAYPLTNMEFSRFVEAGGYQERRWWTEAGWQEKEKPTYEDGPWTKPRWWDDSRFNKPNQPVVGVSWYEAVAYCRWLSAETGQSYRLPTEAEWEKAARGNDGRTYPWGNNFDPSHLNANEGEQAVRATSPVGIYPTGASPFGLFDGVGNVWEWCATEAGKAYPYDVQEDEWTESYLNRTNVRVLRGGSWDDSVNLTRCARRDWVSPSGWISSFGFRIVVVSPLSPPSAL
jgi:formylglycine-generating enzyme required for sulfatase activity